MYNAELYLKLDPWLVIVGFFFIVVVSGTCCWLLYLFARSGVWHILGCVFALFVFVLSSALSVLP